MSFLIKGDKLLKKYSKIWKKKLGIALNMDLLVSLYTM